MVKLFFGSILILLCIGQIIFTFNHHFYPMVDDFGKQSLLWFILIFFGVFLVYSAGKESAKKNIIGFENFDDSGDGC